MVLKQTKLTTTKLAQGEIVPDDSSPKRARMRTLSLFDCICLIIGTMIGAGIFEFPGAVAANVSSLNWLVLAWCLGGLIALIGALCFAELTTKYPETGGDYGYLKRAYHPSIGFAFAWAAFWIIRPGNIGALAMIFGKFVAPFLPIACPLHWLATLAVVAMTLTNLLGIHVGKTIQNTLTILKVLGILLVVLAAVDWLSLSNQTRERSPGPPLADAVAQNLDSDSTESSASSAAPNSAPSSAPATDTQAAESGSFWLAIVFVMFAFGGWNDLAFVAGEVRDPRRNLFLALVLGVLSVLGLYLLVNISLATGLGFERMNYLGRTNVNVTATLVAERFPHQGSRLLSALVAISCLGAINAMIFTSPRIYWAAAGDFPSLRWLSSARMQERGGWRAMLIQCVMTLAFVVVFAHRDGGIDDLVAATAPWFWLFLALTIISVIVLRRRADVPITGFHVPAAPWTPLLFVIACGFMIAQSSAYLGSRHLGIATGIIGAWVGLGWILGGFLGRHRISQPNEPRH